jgi:hypothetical protein
VVSRFVRKVRTASGAVAVQVVTKQGRRVLGIEHVGSAHTDEDLALLVADANARLLPGQDAFDLGDVAAIPARMDDVADWTLPVDRSSWTLSSTSSTAEAGEPRPSGPARPAARVGGGIGRVVSTPSLLLWQVLTSGLRASRVRRPGR